MDERSQSSARRHNRGAFTSSAEHVSVSGQKQWLALTDMISDSDNVPTK